MRTSRYRTLQTPDGQTATELFYGQGLANSLAYLLKGFRGWQCYGLVKISSAHNFGVDVEGVPMCAVYGTRHSEQLEADDPREAAQIAAGRTAVVVFYGIDNSSRMRRMTPAAFDELELTHYRPEPDDLFYNS